MGDLPPSKASGGRSLFDIDNGELTSLPLCYELYSATLLHLSNHGGVGNREHHRHRRHVEVLEFFVLYGELVELGVDLLDDTFRVLLRSSRRDRQPEKRGDGNRAPMVFISAPFLTEW